jgi:hypothetical protein
MTKGNMSLSIDWQTILHRIIAYGIEGLIVALAAYFIPGRKTSLEEIASIALIATATFALLDMYMPNTTIAHNVRVGAGLGIGANLVGFPL